MMFKSLLRLKSFCRLELLLEFIEFRSIPRIEDCASLLLFVTSFISPDVVMSFFLGSLLASSSLVCGDPSVGKGWVCNEEYLLRGLKSNGVSAGDLVTCMMAFCCYKALEDDWFNVCLEFWLSSNLCDSSAINSKFNWSLFVMCASTLCLVALLSNYLVVVN